jgi:hypothetical protein
MIGWLEEGVGMCQKCERESLYGHIRSLGEGVGTCRSVGEGVGKCEMGGAVCWDI